MNQRFKQGSLALAGALFVILLLVVSGIVALNLTFLRKPITRLVESSTGLVVSVTGELHVRLGPNPALRVSGLKFLSGNGASDFARIGDLELGLQLGKLLGGALSLNRVVLNGLVVDTCVPTPTLFRGEPDSTSYTPVISLHRVEGRDIEVGCSGDPKDSPIRLGRLQGNAVSGRDMAVTAAIQWRGREFSVDLEGAPLEELLYSSKPYPFKINATTELAQLELSADIGELFEDLKLSGSIKSRLQRPDDLLALFDMQPAGLPALALEGRVSYSAKQLSLEAMRGHFGAAPWSLSGSLEWGLQRPLLVMTTQLDQLDLDTLLRPGQSPANPQLPAAFHFDRELPLHLLDLADARIDLRLTDLKVPETSAANIALHLELEAGQLQFDLVELQSRLGSGSGWLTLDRAANCPAWTVSASLSEIDLGAIRELVGPGRPIVGTLRAGRATLNACGATLAGLRETLEARVALDTLQIQPGVDLPVIRVIDADMEMGWQRHTLLDAKLSLDEHPVDARIEAGELALLKQDADWPFSVALKSGEAGFKASGSVNSTGGKTSSRADLKFTAPDVRPLARMAGWNPRYQGAVALDMHAYIDAGLLDVADFQLVLDKSDVAGELKLYPGDRQLDSELVLRSGFVDIEELEKLAPLAQESSPSNGATSDIDWPNMQLDLAFARIYSPELSITDVSLVGAFRDERIEDARLELELAALSLVGELDVDLGEDQPRFSMSATMRDVDIGGVLRALNVDKNTDARASQVQLVLGSSGRGGRDLVDNLELDFELRQLDWVLPDQSSAEEVRLSLREVVGTARPDTPLSLHLAGQLDEFPVNGWVRLAPITQILDPVARLPIRAVLGTDQETAMLDGVFNRERGSGLEATLQLSAVERGLAPSEYARLSAPLPGLVIDTRIDLGQGELQTIELAAALADSRVEGKILARHRGDRDHFQIELNAPHLQTEDFSKLVAIFREDENPVAPAVDDQTPQSSSLEILDDYLQGIPERYDFDIRVSIGELMAVEDFLGAADLHAIISRQNLELGELTLSLPGGEVDMNYSITHIGEDIHTKLNAHIEHFEIGGLLQTLDPQSKATGLLYVDTTLDSLVPTTQEPLGAAQGHFDLALFPRDISANVLDLWATNVIFALMPKVESDRKDINCLVTRFEVDQGVMRSKQIMLDSTDVIVRGRGTVDLGRRELDLTIAPQAKRERFLSISSPLTITGPFEDFDVEIAAGSWITTGFRWYLSLIYVPWKWLTGERFPVDGTPTCRKAMGWKVE